MHNTWTSRHKTRNSDMRKIEPSESASAGWRRVCQLFIAQASGKERCSLRQSYPPNFLQVNYCVTDLQQESSVLRHIFFFPLCKPLAFVSAEQQQPLQVAAADVGKCYRENQFASISSAKSEWLLSFAAGRDCKWTKKNNNKLSSIHLKLIPEPPHLRHSLGKIRNLTLDLVHLRNRARSKYPKVCLCKDNKCVVSVDRGNHFKMWTFVKKFVACHHRSKAVWLCRWTYRKCT